MPGNLRAGNTYHHGRTPCCERVHEGHDQGNTISICGLGLTSLKSPSAFALVQLGRRLKGTVRQSCMRCGMRRGIGRRKVRYNTCPPMNSPRACPASATMTWRHRAERNDERSSAKLLRVCVRCDGQREKGKKKGAKGGSACPILSASAYIVGANRKRSSASSRTTPWPRRRGRAKHNKCCRLLCPSLSGRCAGPPCLTQHICR